eukprot:750454-Pyramimonas_sp.AAC.1
MYHPTSVSLFHPTPVPSYPCTVLNPRKRPVVRVATHLRHVRGRHRRGTWEYAGLPPAIGLRVGYMLVSLPRLVPRGPARATAARP